MADLHDKYDELLDEIDMLKARVSVMDGYRERRQVEHDRLRAALVSCAAIWLGSNEALPAEFHRRMNIAHAALQTRET